MWDDYMGWDWYAMRQWAFFSVMFLGVASVIGMTEGYPWHQPITYVIGIITGNSTVALILTMFTLIAVFQFIKFKAGY
jgi:hypothetical protein